jgi:DNA-binding SARP family transcriptional activator
LQQGKLIVVSLCMLDIRLTLFGGFVLSVDGQEMTRFPTDRVRALLTYLALEPAQPHRRERLAGLFWQDASQDAALKNLRQSLYLLRQTLERTLPGVTDRLLRVTPQTVALDPTMVTIDVLSFQMELLQSERHAHRSPADCDECMEALEQAVDRYHGELLAGFGLGDAPAFEEWLLLRRERLHHQALLALNHLALALETRGDLAQAHRAATRQLALDPYREATHRQVIRLLALQGFVHQALTQYETCRRLLREEVGVEPDDETVALAEQIRTGRFVEVKGGRGEGVSGSPGHPFLSSPNHPNTSSPLHKPTASLPPLVGRSQELAQLRALIDQGTPRLLTIVGMGGMGKSRLALALLEQLVAESPAPFAQGVWFVPLIGVAASADNLPDALAGATLKALGITTPNQEALPSALLR